MNTLMDTHGREVTVSSNGTHIQNFVSWEDLQSFRITNESNIPDIEPVVRIGESLFAVRGDISVIGGLPKAGKTALSVYIIGTALKQFGIDEDTLSIRSVVSSAPVIYIDTEQSRAITNKLEKSILSFIGTEKTPENLYVYNFRGIASADKKLHHVKSLFDYFKDKDPHLWIIDGLADLVKNPNDITESFGIISEFMAIAENMKTCIIFYLHENPGIGQKLRGNLGSEIERKCFGAITVRKDREKGIHWIEPRMLRGSSDFPSIYFTWGEKGRMRSLTEGERSEAEKVVDKTAIKLGKLEKLALYVTGNGKLNDIPSATIKSKIIQHHPDVFSSNIDDRQAYVRLSDMVKHGFLEKNEKKCYSLKKQDI